MSTSQELTRQRLANDLVKLMNKRSFTTQAWRDICAAAGAKSGIIQDMGVDVLTWLIPLVKAVKETKK